MSDVPTESSEDTPKQVLPESISIPMIKGEMLQLRPARIEDLDTLESIDTYYGSSTITGREASAERSVVESWVHDSVAWSLGEVDVEATLFAHGLTRTIAWTMLAEVSGSEDPDERRPIGMIFLTQVDAWSHSARIQVVLGRDYRGRGYSRDAMPRVMTYGFAAAPTGLGLHRIWVAVPEKNTRSLSVYQSLGFTIEGTMRHALWDEENDKYQDQVIMGVLVDEYDPVRALDTFGMRMNPDNPGVKEALAAHEHSIEIVKEHKDGMMEVHPTPLKDEAGERDSHSAQSSSKDSDSSDRTDRTSRGAKGGSSSLPDGDDESDKSDDQDDSDDSETQWPYSEHDSDQSETKTSKRAWWRKLGRGRGRGHSTNSSN